MKNKSKPELVKLSFVLHDFWCPSGRKCTVRNGDDFEYEAKAAIRAFNRRDTSTRYGIKP